MSRVLGPVTKRFRLVFLAILCLASLLSTVTPVSAQSSDGKVAVAAVSTAKAAVVLQPNTGRPGDNLKVLAVNLKSRPNLVIAFQPGGLAVRNIVPGDRGVYFHLSIKEGARPGPYTMLVRSIDHPVETYAAAFTVLAPVPARPRKHAARVLRVDPWRVSPGKTYTLNLYGEGFVYNMKVDFGREVQVMSPPVVQTSGRASLRVLISPSALPGVKKAGVKVPDLPVERGPGGIEVVVTTGRKPPVTRKEQPKNFQVIPPHGNIIQVKPNVQGSGEFQQVKMWDDPPMIQKDTVFTWYEDNPGIAKYYVFQIKDKEGNIIVEAQTPAGKPYYRVTTHLLQNLPDAQTVPYYKWTLEQPSGAVSTQNVSSALSKGSQPGQPGYSSVRTSGTLNINASKAFTPTDSQVTSMIGSMSNVSGQMNYNQIVGMIGMAFTDKAQATWQVKGYWENPVTKEIQEVESSVNLPLRLPDKPKGMLNCGVAAQPGALQVECMSATKSTACDAPATYALKGTISLDKDPYPTSVTFASLQSMTLEYSNVYISWGDGTVEPLQVDSGPNWNTDKITLVLNGSPTNPGIIHTYQYPDDYDIKIFSLPTPDQQDPVSVSIASGSSGLYAAALQSISGSGQAPTSRGAGSSGVVGASAVGQIQYNVSGSSSPGALQATAQQSVAANLKVAGADAYLIACISDVHVTTPPDLTKEGPIHLLKVEITDFPGYSGSPAEVSDCAEAFQAEAKLTYYGSKGMIVWVWTVDGEQIVGDFAQLSPASKSDPGTYILKSPPLPVSLSDQAHGVCVRVKTDMEIGGLLKKYSQGMSCPSTPQSGAPKAGSSVVTKTVMRPSMQSFSNLGTTFSAGVSQNNQGGYLQNQASSSSVSTGQFTQNLNANLSSSLPLLINVQLLQTESDVWSEPAAYRVVPHDPNIPCRLYFQAKGGPFEISDVTSLQEESDGTFSGNGILHLAVPKGPDGYDAVFVPLSFSHLTLKGKGDKADIVGGTIDTDPTSGGDLPGEVTGLTGRVAHIKATAGNSNDFIVTFALSVSGMARLEPQNSALDFTVSAPITAEGDFYADAVEPGGDPVTLPTGYIGSSGFSMTEDEVALDWSRSEGDSPPGGSCYGYSGEGTEWIGLYIKSGTLKPYAFGNQSLGQPLSISGWSIGWGGVSGSIPKTTVSQGNVNMGGMVLQINDLSVDLCGSSLKADYGVKLKDVPLVEADIPGTLQVDMMANLSSDFSSPDVTRDFGSLIMELKGADFSNEAGQGWRVALDTLFTFKTRGKVITQVPVDGIRVKGNGESFWKDGTQGASIPLGGSASIGPLKMDLVKLNLKLGTHHNKPSIEFALSGKFHVSDVLAPSSNTFVYNLQSNSPMFAAEPGIDGFSLEASYPLVNPKATLKAKVTWSEDAQGNYTFIGHGSLSLLNTGDIDADFLLGYKNGKDYWLCRVSVPLGPSGVPLYPPFLTLYQIQGGLGHNIPLTSFSSNGGLASLNPTMDDSYLFMAGVRVGDTGGGWLYTFQGNLTVKTAGADAGFRIDIKAWVMTSDHSGNGQFQGYIQYAGSSFDAGLSGEYHVLSDKIWVKAPNGAVNLHFGPGNWHIYLGQNVDGLRLQAHCLVSDCYGWLTLDNNGLKVGGVVTSSFHYGGSLWGFGAHVNGSSTYSMEIGIGPDPTWGIHLSGDYSISISLEAGIDTPAGCLCIHPTVGLDISASAMPVSVCGKAYLSFGCICVCPCWDFSWDCCCHCYGTTVGGICVTL